MFRVVSLAILVSVLSFPATLPAQTKQTQKRNAMVVDRWIDSLEKADRMLEQGKWKKAKWTANRLLSEMCDRIQSGSGTENLLASAVFIRAVAEAGLGDERSAHWDFLAAQTLDAQFSKMRFERYGPSASVLESWRVSSEENPWGKDEIPDADSALSDRIQPPKKIHSPKPKYPFGKQFGCIEGPIQVQVVIDEQGFPTWPKLLTTQDPILGFAAIDALREWRFQPAQLDGKPVKVFYNLTANFQNAVCRPTELL